MKKRSKAEKEGDAMQRFTDAEDHAAVFRATADGELFARAAAELWGWTLAPVTADTSDGKDEGVALEELPFPVFYERRQIVFEAASFSSIPAQALAVELFSRLGADVAEGATYAAAHTDAYLAPLRMATAEFLAALEDPEEPYEAVTRFLATAARERPLYDECTELEEFLATTAFRVRRRDFPRWKDMFHLALKRQKAAEAYAAQKRTPVTEAELAAFVAAYRAAQENPRKTMEAADCAPAMAEASEAGGENAQNESAGVALDARDRKSGGVSHRDLRRTHKVLVDADACPVVRLIEKLCERHDVPVALFCDDHHEMASSYSEVIRVPRGKHAADYAIVGLCRKGDIVVTEDTGLAMLILAKEAYPIAADGWRYTARLPWQAADPRAARRTLHSRMHKRSAADDEAFERGFLALLHRKFFGEDEW